MREDLLILYSGGADSRLMLELALKTGKKPYCVLIDYGQLHIEELEFARKHLDKKKIEHQTVKIAGLNIKSGLTGDGKKSLYEGVHSHNVPGRNTMFLAIAMSIAENRGITKMWYGPDFSDYLGLFPDCYQQYVGKMREVMQIAGCRPIDLEAPLLGMTKQLILELLKSFGVKKEELFSCYGEFA
jgi:7-cyano-7-deazaguanine synthase